MSTPEPQTFGLSGITPSHTFNPEWFTGHGNLIIGRASCEACGLYVITRGRTVRRAKKRLRRAADDHRGTVYAAGPGWQVAA